VEEVLLVVLIPTAATAPIQPLILLVVTAAAQAVLD
jgi:hypothetical protein